MSVCVFSETDLFFLAISMVGTDFSLIGQLLSHRSRAEIKVFSLMLVSSQSFISDGSNTMHYNKCCLPFIYLIPLRTEQI